MFVLFVIQQYIGITNFYQTSSVNLPPSFSILSQPSDMCFS